LIRVDPHLPGTVPFTWSVAALLFAQDLLMQEYGSKLRFCDEKKQFLFVYP
jgi:hypothetical protein